MSLLTSILAYWKLDELSGTSAADATGNGHTGTLQASTSFAAGKINNGITQNAASGVGIVAGTSDSLDLTQYPLSVAAWFKTSRTTSTPNGDGMIFSKQLTASPFHQYVLGLDYTTGTVHGTYSGSGGNTTLSSSTTGYNDNAWHHAVLTISAGGAMVLYVDGVSKATGTASGTLNTGKKTTIGINWDVGVNNPWYGGLDEVGVWNRELTSAEVTSLYGGGAGFQYPFPGGVVNGLLAIL